TQDAAIASAKGNADPSARAQVEGIDAHRFDALINLAAGALADGGLPTRHGKRPAIAITVALSTLLGLDDQPADLAGYGPITAEAARRAAADPTGTWQRLIITPKGLVADAAYTSYRPPQALCDTVVARDRTCTFPRCSQPALRCDIDHQDAWPDGSTCLGNNHALCRGHHILKTAGMALPVYDPVTGDTLWTLPSGQSIRRPAERHWQFDPEAAAHPCRECGTDTHGDQPCPAIVPCPPAPPPARPRLLRAIADTLGSIPSDDPGATLRSFDPMQGDPIKPNLMDDYPPPPF
ncbi:MAG: hypothetical protein JWN61_283, partial [Pseudonocardiales bacterium]|nr:hypothetical protein [Pseudonocardiales bacterium]